MIETVFQSSILLQIKNSRTQTRYKCTSYLICGSQIHVISLKTFAASSNNSQSLKELLNFVHFPFLREEVYLVDCFVDQCLLDGIADPYKSVQHVWK